MTKPQQSTAIAVVLMLLIGAAAVFALSTMKPLAPSPTPTQPGVVEGPPEEPSGPPGSFALGADACASAGGTFNECGSACRGAPPDTACILMCVSYCECKNSTQCPSGYSCGDYVDGTGVCAKR